MIINISIPIIFIVVGFLLKKYPPKYRNYVLGYKSPIYMKNEDAWYEGNRFFGTLFFYGGIVEIILYFIISTTQISQNLLPICYVLIALICIICTETHLFRMFRNKSPFKKG